MLPVFLSRDYLVFSSRIDQTLGFPLVFFNFVYFRWRDFMLRFLHTLCYLAIWISTSANLLAEEPPGFDTFIDSLGRSTIETNKAVGLSIGIAQGDEILYAQGFGLANVELDVPATADSVYRIGSITKEFTAAGILLLVEDGVISLDDPLCKFLPDYPVKGSEITVRNLLHHTSGVKDFTRLPNYRSEIRLEVVQEEVLNRFQHLPLDFEPGERRSYCNSGYFILGVIIEKASGQSYEQFIEERLLRPLELERTSCDSPSRIIPNRAAGYSCWGDVLRNAPYMNMDQTIGAGNMASTVEDLLVWQHSIVDDRLLSPDSRRMMTTRGKLNNGEEFNYGLGLVLQKFEGREVVRHGGGILGFRADIAHYPDSGYTIAVLANCDNVNASGISNQIARLLLVENEDD
jgi:D-alanyl-D-alanine carboxypeptidase